MKLIIKIGFTLIMLSISNTYAEKKTTGCEGVHTMASSVMELRQLGAAMPKVMTVLSLEGLGENENKILKSMIISAYESPKFSGEKYQENAIEEFANEWALKCYKW